MSKLKIGRNEKCPCGSGKKYKNCCMLKDEIQRTIHSKLDKYKNAEKDLVSLIMKYSRSPENEKDFEKAIEAFFGGELSEININDTEFSFFMAWYIKNYNLETPFIDKIIKKERNKASKELMELLYNLKASGLYLYKIKGIKNGIILFQSLHKDLEIEVIDEVLEQNVNVNDIIYTRVYKTGDFYKLFGGTMFIPYFMVNEILTDIENAWNNSDKSVDYDTFLQLYSLEIIRKLNTDIPDDRIIYNEDNELLQYSILKYKVLEKNKCVCILEGMKELTKKEEDSEVIYQWSRNSNNIEIIMGEISISEDELRVETDSFERRIKLQEILDNNLKDTVKFVDEEYLTIHQLKEETEAIRDDEKSPDEIERLILDNMKMEYTPLQIKEAMLMTKSHKTSLKRLKPESVAAAIEYIISTKENLSKTQKDIADKYNISPGTVGKWAKYIQEQL